MADVTMCQNESCKNKYKCFRYMAEPSQEQSYGAFVNCNERTNYENSISNYDIK